MWCLFFVVHAVAHACVCARRHQCVYLSVCTYMYLWVCVFIYECTYDACVQARRRPCACLSVRLFVCLYVCFYVCMYICLYMCFYSMYACMCVRACVCMYVCIYVCPLLFCLTSYLLHLESYIYVGLLAYMRTHASQHLTLEVRHKNSHGRIHTHTY